MPSQLLVGLLEAQEGITREGAFRITRPAELVWVALLREPSEGGLELVNAYGALQLKDLVVAVSKKDPAHLTRRKRLRRLGLR